MIDEAINELKKYTLGRKNTEKVEISVLQINRVIKALEQEPCEDAISRQAVEKIISKWLSHPDYELKDGIYDMTKKIHKLPSVTPQQKTGHWIAETDVFGDICYRCSKCRRLNRFLDNYCPNCGQPKMQEVEENDD